MSFRETRGIDRKKSICNCTHANWVHAGWIQRCFACACERFNNKRRNKLNAQRTETAIGVKDSKWEGKVGMDLEYQKRAGLIKDFKSQVKIPLYADGIHITDYKCDYAVEHNDGTIEYVEAKGMEGERFRLIKKLMEVFLKNNPTARYTVVKQTNGWRPR